MARANLDNMDVKFYQDKGIDYVRIMNAEILFGSFRNFTGIDTKFPSVDANGNPKRFFNISIPYDYIQAFCDQGISVKFWRGGDSDEDGNELLPGFTKVHINYNYSIKPVVVVRNGEYNDDGSVNENWIEFTESTIGTLQRAEFDNVTLILRIARGTTQFGKPYTSLYLDKAWITKHVEKPNMYEAEVYDYYGYKPTQNSQQVNEPVSSDEPLPFA